MLAYLCGMKTELHWKIKLHISCKPEETPIYTLSLDLWVVNDISTKLESISRFLSTRIYQKARLSLTRLTITQLKNNRFHIITHGSHETNTRDSETAPKSVHHQPEKQSEVRQDSPPCQDYDHIVKWFQVETEYMCHTDLQIHFAALF